MRQGDRVWWDCSSTSQEGTAIVAALIFLLLATIIAAAMAGSARIQLLRAGAYANGAKAYYLAEAGVAAALTGLPAGLAFTDALLGEDQIAGTEDDGTLPYADILHDLPLMNEGEVTLRSEDDLDENPNDPRADSNDRILLWATGTTIGLARRSILAVIGRADSPYNPAAAMMLDPVVELGYDFAIDGRNYQVSNGCGSLVGDEAKAGLALADADAGSALTAALLLSGAERIKGAGEAPSIIPLRATKVVDLQGSMAGADAVLPAGAISGSWGDSGTPVLTLVAGDATVSGSFQGIGALVVRGELTVSGVVDFSGILIATRGINLTPTGSLNVCGGLWSAGPVRNNGSLHARYSAQAVQLADSCSRLVRLPELIAVREDF